MSEDPRPAGVEPTQPLPAAAPADQPAAEDAVPPTAQPAPAATPPPVEEPAAAAAAPPPPGYGPPPGYRPARWRRPTRGLDLVAVGVIGLILGALLGVMATALVVRVASVHRNGPGYAQYDHRGGPGRNFPNRRGPRSFPNRPAQPAPPAPSTVPSAAAS